jgi:hypothetical protein
MNPKTLPFFLLVPRMMLVGLVCMAPLSCGKGGGSEQDGEQDGEQDQEGPRDDMDGETQNDPRFDDIAQDDGGASQDTAEEDAAEQTTFPFIASVSGSMVNGQRVNILGTGFRAKAQAAPLISSYDHPVAENNWISGAIGSNWLTWNSPSLDTSNPRAPIPQSSYNINYDASGEYDAIGLSHGVPDDKIYISYWMYRDYPAWNGSPAGGNQKWTRIYESTSHDDLSASIMTSTVWDGSGDLDVAYFCPEHAPSCAGWTLAYTAPIYNATAGASEMWCVYLGDGHPALRTWEHWEYYVDYPAAVAMSDAGTVLWKNGATVARSVGIAIDEAGNPNTARDIVIGQVSGAQSASSDEYLDQIYIDNTPAHVFVSDKADYSWPDYGQEAHNEIQVPLSWSDDAVEVTFNQGSFSNGEAVYVYVVRDTGEISNSYPVTIGD